MYIYHYGRCVSPPLSAIIIRWGFFLLIKRFMYIYSGRPHSPPNLIPKQSSVLHHETSSLTQQSQRVRSRHLGFPPFLNHGNHPLINAISLQPNTAKNQLTTDLKTMAAHRGCIPEDILFEIFTRLPVKSLCRFRCVSKLCFSIISDPDFVTAHLARSRSRPKLLISVQYRDPLRDVGMYAFFSIDYPHVQDSGAQPLRATSHSSTEVDFYSMISTSPSGLICFTNNEEVKIGNPITGDFDVIPYPQYESVPSNVAWCRSFFFGFDRVEKSHVILKLEERDYTRNYDPDDPKSGKSAVFDLVENCWHDSQPHPWLRVSSVVESHICINGVIYFTAESDISDELDFCLYAFDVRLKSFQMIERPPDSLPPYYQGQRFGERFGVELLIEYKGRVAFVGYGDLEGTIEDEIKMWILDDLENHIWSFKSFVIPWRENLLRDGVSMDAMDSINYWDRNNPKVSVFGATRKGELILATSLWNCPCYLFFYEIETETLRRFEVDGFGNIPRGPVRFNWLVESLQSPDSCSVFS